MKITDIKPQAKNKSRVSIFADGEFLCGLEKLTALEHRLNIGDEIDPESLAAAVHDSECAAAFEKAAGYLGSRPRTKREVLTYLGGKGYSEDVCAATLDKLERYGYVNDAEFCKAYVEEYSRKAGVRKIEADLRAKGVDYRLIDAALENLDNTDAAVRLAKKYLSSHAPDMRKLTAYLLGKGFEYDTVKDAFEKLRDEEDD